jgi:hypothetical protein
MNAGQAARSVYAKICALIILTYVVLMCLVGFITSPTIGGLRIGLMAGLMFGIPAGLLLGGVPAILYYFHRRAFQGKVKYADDFTTHPTRTIDVDLPMQAAFDLVQEALPLLTIPPNTPEGSALFGKLNWRLNNTAANRDKGVILTWLRRRWNLYDTSRITVNLEQLDTHTTRIIIRSQPQWAFMIFDYGLNLHNVALLATYIREQASLKTGLASRLAIENDSVHDVENPSENRRQSHQ